MATSKRPSLLSVTTNTVRNFIESTSLVTDELLEASLYGAKTINTTAKYGYAANAAWAAEGMSEFSDEERAYLESVDPDFKLPPRLESKDDTDTSVVSEQ